MNYDDSDWTHEAAAASAATVRPRRDVTLAGTLALGIVIGVAGTLLAVLALGRGPRGPAAPEPALAAAPAAVGTSAAPAVQVAPTGTSPTALVERVPPEAGTTAPVASAPATHDANDEAEPPPVAAAPSRPISAEEQKRRERAWAKFYRRPASCEGNPTTDQLIECANHFIRSKREFDERWKAGTL
jgi:hypothetical protein